jgi:hypothetical protein
MYSVVNYKTKKALKEAFARGERIEVYQVGPFAASAPTDGDVVLEGPHYPEPHRWYAGVTIKDSVVTKIK